MNRFQGAGVLGYYNGDDERVRIRGTNLTPAIESTLVHELTKALQDQHFNITERTDKLDKAEDSAASGAFDAVIEGDARRIEDAWAESLSKAEKKALDKSEAEQGEQFEQDAADVPEVVQTLMTTEYAFGEALLWVAEQDGGEDAVNDLFEDPPTNEEHEFDPWTHLDDHDKAGRVPEPDLDDGARKFDNGALRRHRMAAPPRRTASPSSRPSKRSTAGAETPTSATSATT